MNLKTRTSPDRFAQGLGILASTLVAFPMVGLVVAVVSFLALAGGAWVPFISAGVVAAALAVDVLIGVSVTRALRTRRAARLVPAS